MLDFLTTHYLSLKALHLISVMAWMAGLWYVPRLFIYQTLNRDKPDVVSVMLTMQAKVIRIIATPAMLSSFLFGGMLLIIPGVLGASSGWLHAKLSLVLVLAGFHGYLVATHKRFLIGSYERSVGYYRILNEVPTILLVFIVFLVVLKPF
ncbi:MAG: protoporphyrinogen oxidase HemJ [Alphaproteobacteria bacterium]|nr:protoporphyrinogen oxidase HemJ [Alphaproteobacteria bacterium]